jgi:hypothetical protein
MTPLTIKIKGDNTGLKTSTAEAVAKLQAVDAAAKQTGEATTRGFTASRNAAGQFVKGTGDATAAVAKLGAKTKEVAEEGAGGFRKMGAAGVQSFGAIGLSMSLAQMGMQAVKQLADGIADSMKKAADQARQYSAAVTASRNTQRELAATLGVKPDNKFLYENAKFGKAAAMMPPEVVAFRNQLANSGVQFRGSNITEKGYETFEQKSAAYSQAKGLDAGTGGDFFGGVLGLQNLTGLGDEGGWKRALGTGARQLAILGQGRGEQAVLARQMAMVNSALFSEDKLRGSISDPNEAATLVSIAAEKSPMSAGEMTRAALRGLSDYNDKKAGPFLASAGIVPGSGMSPIEKLRKLAPLVDAEAAKTGMTTDEVLREKFPDILAAEGIGVYLNQGIAKGGFDKRMALAATLGGDEKAQETIAEYQATSTGRAAIADAGVYQAQVVRGMETSRIETIRKQALEQLIQSKQIDTAGTNLTDYVKGAIPFASLDEPRQQRITEHAERMLEGRGADVGLAKGKWFSRPDLNETALNQYMDRIEAKGKDPLDLSKLEALMEENNELQRKMLAERTSRAPAVLPAGPMPLGKRGAP